MKVLDSKAWLLGVFLCVFCFSCKEQKTPMAEAEVKWKNLQAEVSALQRELQQAQAEAKQQYENAKQLLASAKAQPSPAQPEKPANDLNNQIKLKISKLEKDFKDQNEKIVEKLSIHDHRFILVEQDISTLRKEVRSTAHLHRH